VRNRGFGTLHAVVAVATGIAIGRPEALLDGALTLARSILEEPWWLDLAR
jgi:hypothetical protein